MDKAEGSRINKMLAANFGQIDGRLPVFRLTWSTNEMEYVAGSGRVKKYPMFADRWVLERLCEAPESVLPEFRHTYEPLWVFQSDDGRYMEPNEKAIVFLVHTLLYREAKRVTQKDLDEKQSAEEKREVEEFIQMMEEEYPVLSSRKELGEVAFLNRDGGER